MSSASVASRVVRGVILPVPISGHPALELCNTRAGWGEPSPKEYLTGPRELHRLVDDLGLLPGRLRRLDAMARDDPGRALAVHRRVLRLREDVYAVLTRRASPAAVSRVSTVVRQAASARRFDGVTPAGAVWSWAAVGPELPLLALGLTLRQLLSSPDAALLGACPGSGCGWLFLDRTGRRRWCSMRWCGNRAKAARHAAGFRD